ncbi:hypothetical protein GCM10009069_22700 [Algimonas arctica]|uniref:Uncharacterized protein n=1 Tax=Algimonas arctica TaxID=1479486 RepID=A0A8J3CRK2_9PROT|nr:hypothetical protein [Algimonas arctica]GHA99380.1 hypothetical protein GCM10009069_22700 [Algimonas arctica]
MLDFHSDFGWSRLFHFIRPEVFIDAIEVILKLLQRGAPKIPEQRTFVRDESISVWSRIFDVMEPNLKNHAFFVRNAPEPLVRSAQTQNIPERDLGIDACEAIIDIGDDFSLFF